MHPSRINPVVVTFVLLFYGSCAIAFGASHFGIPSNPAPSEADASNAALPEPVPQALTVNQVHVTIPRLESAPKLKDFLVSPPASAAARKMLRVTDFIERNPDDGKIATEATTAYLGYTHEYLFVVFLCRDSQPSLMRAHLLPRDSLGDDDWVEVMLDTFHDRRRAYLFKVNPLGVQADALYTEQQGSDYSFDTVWDTWGKRLRNGYAVMLRIPFASLLFKHVPPGQRQTWGIVLQRNISRKNESDFWPRIRHDIAGRLTQEIAADGFADIERGRNLQFEPYGLLHSLRQLNTVDPLNPYFNDKHLQGYTGLDTRFVFHNSLTLDMTFNPDFSQIGIDDPAPPNQRFQFYYPELRPFFIENASYFATPINLYYTPNIVMPQFGQRLSGKVGRWALGLLNVDDRSPGLNVPRGSPDYGTRSHFYIGRVNRDIGRQSDIGVIFADQQYLDSFNRAGGLDYRSRLGDRWTMTGQAVTTETQNPDNSWQSGQAYTQSVSYSDLHKSGWLQYEDTAAGYVTNTGFFTRPDMRRPNGSFNYTFRPKTGSLLSHGPSVYFERIWDHTGLPLDFYFDPSYYFSFKRRTSFSANLNLGQDRLRPVDYPVLTSNVEYHSSTAGFNLYTSPMPWFAVGLVGYGGRVVNYDPPANQGPSPVDVQSGHVNLDVKPLQSLDLSNSYEFDRFTSPTTGAVAYDNHQVVSRWNLQMTKAWSINLIGEYLATLPSETYTDLPNTKDVFGDALLTYLPHPGTAFYLGYTTDYQNLDHDLCERGPDGICNPNAPILPRTTGSTPFLNDQRVIYMKMSYLLRF